MAADRPPELHDVGDVVAHRISKGDTVYLAVLRDTDDSYDASIFLEIWEPGGSQPFNSHLCSTETFLILRGRGVAYCDDEVVPIRAGQFLVLPRGSVHRIENTTLEKLYAITTMSPDDGFAELVRNGEVVALEPDDRAVLAQAAGPDDFVSG
jgi:mannose-6-phosphate isomerase-like protein (cupin superfamily)